MQTEKKNYSNVIIYLVYVLLFALFVFKMFFYSNERFAVPDQRAQMSYIIYMEQNPSILVPEFSDIRIYDITETLQEDNQVIYEMEPINQTCYLGHPPLYYKLMQLCGTVELGEGDTVYVNYTKLANCNILLTAFAMLLILITGYKLLEKKNASWYLHLFYVAICTTLPLYGYLGGGVNNDNLCNLGLVIFWMGLVNYLEKGYSYKTFWLVALGLTISTFAKLTAGLIALLVTAIIIVTDIIKTRKLGIIFNKYFVTTMPLYLVVLSYFITIKDKYGSFQPSYKKYAPLEEYLSSSFYVAEEDRVVRTFWQVMEHYFGGLWQTWKATYNSSFMIEREGVVAIGYAIVLILFIGCIGYEIFSYIKGRGKNNSLIATAFGLTIIFVILKQAIGHYNTYLSRGYTGGYQSRYYMPCIPIIAIGACDFLYMIKEKSRIALLEKGKYILLILSIILIYADFFYFLISAYRQGIMF